MLITNHVLVGALVGTLSPSSKSAYLLGVVSHFACDAIPHYGGIDKEDFLALAVKDGLRGLALMGAITSLTPKPARKRVFMGMLGACTPDANKPSKLVFGRSPFPQFIERFHSNIQIESLDKLKFEQTLMIGGSLVAALSLYAAHRRSEV